MKTNETYYAVCNVNGPISTSIEADSVDAAVEIFESLDHQGLIDNAEADADADLDIDGYGMTEEAFTDELYDRGFCVVRDLAPAHNYHSGTTAHVQGGWMLFGPAAE